MRLARLDSPFFFIFLQVWMHSQNTSFSLKRTKQHINLSKMQSKQAALREMKRTEMNEECVWKLNDEN